MTTSPVAFIYGDRSSRPHKANRSVEHFIRHFFTAQGFVGLGIAFHTICIASLPPPYGMLPGALVVLLAALPTLLRWLRLAKPGPEEATRIIGAAAAYLDFADPAHAGKQPGHAAFPPAGTAERKPPRLAVMLIGSQCHSPLGILQPEYKEMGDVFAGMIRELRAAPPEEDTGFLNADFYMSSAQHTNNSNMVVIYFRSYAHMLKLAHAKTGAHWVAWNQFRKLQRDKTKLGTEIGLWHEVYEVSNAEGIYLNMPRIGLGDMWDAVRAPNGEYVYRNALVTATGLYTMSEGRMGYHSEKQAPDGEKPLMCSGMRALG